MRRAAQLLIAVLAPVSFAQAAPRVDVGDLEALQQADQRVADIGWRLLASSVDLCPMRSDALGITLHNLAQYAPEVRRTAQQAFAFSGGLPSVLSVAKNSPAAMAGVKPNDILVRIGSNSLSAIGPTPPAPAAAASYAAIDRAMRLLEELPGGQGVELALLRGGEELTVMLRPQTICRSRIELAPSNAGNANANGEVAQISSRLAVLLAKDDELALVLGHEVAHNQLGHPGRIASEKLMSGLLPGLGPKGKQLRDMERSADRFGLLMAARAGFDYRIAPSFWERFTRRSGLGSIWATTHPNAKNRREHLATVVTEIDQGKCAPSPIDPGRGGSPARLPD